MKNRTSTYDRLRIEHTPATNGNTEALLIAYREDKPIPVFAQGRCDDKVKLWGREQIAWLSTELDRLYTQMEKYHQLDSFKSKSPQEPGAEHLMRAALYLREKGCAVILDMHNRNIWLGAAAILWLAIELHDLRDPALLEQEKHIEAVQKQYPGARCVPGAKSFLTVVFGNERAPILIASSDKGEADAWKRAYLSIPKPADWKATLRSERL